MERGIWDTQDNEKAETGKKFKRVSVRILHSAFPISMKFRHSSRSIRQDFGNQEDRIKQ